MSVTFQLFGTEAPTESSPEVRFLVGNLPSEVLSNDGRVLSPWIPAELDDCLRGNSATEISLNMLLAEGPPPTGMAVAAQLGIDNILACFCLLQPAIASRHRETLVNVAEMGLYQAWGTRREMSVYQRLQTLLRNARNCREEQCETFRACFRSLPAILASDGQSLDPRPEEHAEQLLDHGPIIRELLHRRFVSYLIPRSLHRGVYYKALRISPVDAPLDDSTLLSCRVRNRLDSSRNQLISVEAQNGWYHDLLYPAWMWANTIGRYRSPGFYPGLRPGSWKLDFPQLKHVVERLQQREKNSGRWFLGDDFHPFERSSGRGFPVILYFEDGRGNPAVSSLPPQEVADRLCRLFGPASWDS